MSERRRRILNWDLHPIAVHFPTAFAVALTVFSCAVPFFSGNGRELLVDTNKILVLFMPLVVLISFGLGWLDGVVRFRKIKNSQILKRKILYASLLLVVSVGLGLAIWLGEFSGAGLTAAAMVLSAAAVVLTTLLGLLGVSITGSAFPGK